MITISEYLQATSPVAYGALSCWAERDQYRAARGRILGRLGFRMLDRLMRQVPGFERKGGGMVG